MPNRPLAAALAAALLALAAGQAAAQGQPPEISEKRNGFEAEFRNGCVVRFDRSGDRRSASDKCGPNQIERAEAAIAGRTGAAASGGGGPEVTPARNGELDVSFPNGCMVFYRSDGDRKGDNERCSRDQRDRADDAAERYRRDHDLSGDRPGAGPGPRPEIVDRRGGEFDVQFTTGCAAFYDEDGDRRDDNGRCARDELNRADAAAERYAKRNPDRPGVGGDGPLPTVTKERDGSPLVEYSNGCTVRFEQSGRFIGGSKACSKDQIERARKAAYEARTN